MQVGYMRGRCLDHRTAGDAYPEEIGRINSAGQALLEAREQILAKSIRAGAEAADRILRQERAALEILTCAWDDCNERATMRCPWFHQLSYCSLEPRDVKFELHGVECWARATDR